jgi:phosphomannomutase
MALTVPGEIFKAYDVRGLYGEQIDGDVAEAVGRAFARVLAERAGKPADQLGIGLGRDMRLSAPELAARYRAGLMAEGAHVLDAGMVGTEMLYWLVGSRELDGGLMCTASHNPKAYTGAKLVERGAVALSGDSGIGEIRRLVHDGLGAASGGGTCEEVDVYAPFQEAALAFIDPPAVKPLKVVVDGGNGMAGPMVGPLLERLGLDLVTNY